MLKTMLFAAAVLAAGPTLANLAFTDAAFADEVIIHRDAPAAVVEEPAPSTSTTTVEKHTPDCDSKSVHSENDAGDSKTVTHEDCD